MLLRKSPAIVAVIVLLGLAGLGLAKKISAPPNGNPDYVPPPRSANPPVVVSDVPLAPSQLPAPNGWLSVTSWPSTPQSVSYVDCVDGLRDGVTFSNCPRGAYDDPATYVFRIKNESSLTWQLPIPGSDGFGTMQIATMPYNSSYEYRIYLKFRTAVQGALLYSNANGLLSTHPNDVKYGPMQLSTVGQSGSVTVLPQQEIEIPVRVAGPSEKLCNREYNPTSTRYCTFFPGESTASTWIAEVFYLIVERSLPAFFDTQGPLPGGYLTGRISPPANVAMLPQSALFNDPTPIPVRSGRFPVINSPLPVGVIPSNIPICQLGFQNCAPSLETPPPTFDGPFGDSASNLR
jgi:hypothetical protein